MIGYFTTNRMQVQLEEEDPDVSLAIVAAEPLGYYGPVLQLDDVSAGYVAGKPMVEHVTLNIDTSSRIVFLGPNGVGKSTLLSTIAGDLPPLSGTIQRHPRLRVAYFAQHSLEALPQEDSAVKWIMTEFPGSTEQDARGHLSKFGVSGKTAVLPIKMLSGGQRCRVSLAKLVFKPPHVLMLDEPTNHLDLDTVTALIDALANFQGGLVLVSHDRRLIKAAGKTFLMVKDKRLVEVTAKQMEKFLGSMSS